MKRSIWRYGLFQIPAILLAICLVAAGVAAILNLGCPIFWIWLFLGLAWASFMWMLVLPIDYLLRFSLKLDMSLAGRIAIFHAIFWSSLVTFLLIAHLPSTIATCQLSSPTFENPLTKSEIVLEPEPEPEIAQESEIAQEPITVSELETINLDWRPWRARVWNSMFYGEQYPSEWIGLEVNFSFVVDKDGNIFNINVESPELSLEEYTYRQINQITNADDLNFPSSSERSEILYEGSLTICNIGFDEGCGDPIRPEDYPEEIESVISQ